MVKMVINVIKLSFTTMKKFSRIILLSAVLFVLAAESSNAQEIIVRERMHRPGAVAFRRPFRPSPRHVWVAEEWAPVRGTYVYHAGYWAIPPHRGGVWVAGYWRHRPGGFVWIPGYWR